ncbi:MAG: hypothetical protein K1X88_23175 [Nannocystaceae bacterium]|nr:hypothetical protein [Nannocystaceae bacterium]
MDPQLDVEARIAQLEQELTELRGSRPKATRVAPMPEVPRRRGTLTIVALALFATSLPIASWLQVAARDEQTAQTQRRAYKYERALQLSDQRQERTMKFVDAALDPKRSRGEREAALRFLAEELGPKSAVRAWARKELARGCGH